MSHYLLTARKLREVECVHAAHELQYHVHCATRTNCNIWVLHVAQYLSIATPKYRGVQVPRYVHELQYLSIATPKHRATRTKRSYYDYSTNATTRAKHGITRSAIRSRSAIRTPM